MRLAGVRRLFGRLADDVELYHSLLAPTIFLVFWLGMGTVGYAVLEDWPLLDAAYMAVITVSTIGFQEVHDLSTYGRIFTIGFAFVGIGAAAFVGTRWASLVLADRLLRQRRQALQLRRMENHYILCGHGRVGNLLRKELVEGGSDVVVVDTNAETIARLKNRGTPAIHGNATDDEVLIKAGVRRAKGLIAALPNDSDNVFITLVAREYAPEILILSRIAVEHNRRKMLRAGATHVIAPSNVGALRMAQVILRPNVDRFMSEVLTSDNEGLLMDEATIEHGSFLADKTLADTGLRQHFSVIVVSIIKGATQKMRFNPGPEELIEGGDILIVLGPTAAIDRMREEGCTA